MLKTLMVLFLTCFPFVAFGDDFATLSPEEEEEEGRMVWIGFDPNEPEGPIPTPYIDERFKVVAIHELELSDVGETYIDCFVEIGIIPWFEDEEIPIDEHGWPYVEDLDGELRPIYDIQVDTTTCTSPSGAVGEP